MKELSYVPLALWGGGVLLPLHLIRGLYKQLCLP